MNVEITLKLSSPLMIGGKSLNDNYRKSQDMIPGSVLRAAFARTISDRCPYGDDLYDGKRYWVHYREQDECADCPLKQLCQNFGQISFSTLYPLGGAPFPATARECKYPKHPKNTGCPSDDCADACKNPLRDILRSRLMDRNYVEERTLQCSCGAAMEKITGIHLNGAEIKLINHLVTKTAIDARWRRARDGQLYSLDTVSPQLDHLNETKATTFSGTLALPDNLPLNVLTAISALRVGAYITRGMGKCTVTYRESSPFDTREDLQRRIEQFNAGLPENQQYWYITINLLADAYLDLEKASRESADSPTGWDDEQFLTFLAAQIDFPHQLLDVYKNYELRRGFDIAQPEEKDMRRPGHVVIKAGSLLVYRVAREQYDLEQLFQLQAAGIGKQREHGFGRIIICDPFHIQYDALKGDEK